MEMWRGPIGQRGGKAPTSRVIRVIIRVIKVIGRGGEVVPGMQPYPWIPYILHTYISICIYLYPFRYRNIKRHRERECI